jgi:hypothetical protein
MQQKQGLAADVMATAMAILTQDVLYICLLQSPGCVAATQGHERR